MSFLYWYPVTVNCWTCCTVSRIVKDLVSHVSCTTLGRKRKCCRMNNWRTHDRSWPQGMHGSTQPSQSRICQCWWHGSCDLSLTTSHNWSQKTNHGFISSTFIPTNYIHTTSIHPWWNSGRTRIIRVALFHWYIVPLHLLSEGLWITKNGQESSKNHLPTPIFGSGRFQGCPQKDLLLYW